MNARDGEEIEPRDVILKVMNPTQLWIDAFLPERHAEKLRAGMRVRFRVLDGGRMLEGRVESIRAGVGRIPYEGFNAVMPGEFTQRRVAVRVRIESPSPFPAEEFHGVGRSVVLQLDADE